MADSALADAKQAQVKCPTGPQTTHPDRGDRGAMRCTPRKASSPTPQTIVTSTPISLPRVIRVSIDTMCSKTPQWDKFQIRAITAAVLVLLHYEHDRTT